MLRRPTSSPETLRYARESPTGAGPSWCTGTSLVAQTAGHASVAEVAQEAVARARLIPEDVRLVMGKEVTGYGVVPGFHRSAEERIGRDYDPARDGGGTGGNVARDLVARNLHATGAENRDADPREIYPFWGSTRARIVLDRVAFHLEVTYGLRRESFEEHARAVVVDRVSGEEAAVGVDDGDAPRAARDVVANDRGTRELKKTLMPSVSVSGLPITWFFATVVLTLLKARIPPATLPMVRFPTTVALRAPVTSITNAPFPAILKPRIVKPETLTPLTRCPSSLSVLRFTSPRTQIASGPKAFEQGESALALGGASITASSPRSFIPFLRITTSSR